MTDKRSRKWCMTINNYSDDELTQIHSMFEEKALHYIIGKEIGEEEKTKHLQIFIQYKSARRFSSMKKTFPRAHIEIAKGSLKHNFEYCSKDGDFLSNIDLRSPQDKIKEKVLNDEYKNVEWHEWQSKVIDILNGKPDKRKIHWFHERIGNAGKSYLCKYLALTRNVIIAEGKKADIFNQVLTMLNKNETPKIILLDIPRTVNDYISYSAIEQLKNGFMYSGKYEGGVCIFPIPHVICFSNQSPHREALSEDRWDIIEIGE